MTWEAAQNEAGRLDGNLVSIRNEEFNNWLIQTFKDAPELQHPDYSDPAPGWVQIGLVDSSKTGNWTWHNEQKLTYSNWEAGEPNGKGFEDRGEMCLTGNRQGFWNDKRDNFFLPGIIECINQPSTLR